ncbi:MAG: hypothetical protein HYX73_07205 [Acidobacteria bacterium]|nr:hypothetical protein [Acidobacteriota bacterium]
MKPFYKPVWVLISLWTVLCIAAPGQSQAQGPSLADLARQTRAKKEQAPTTGKVFTNDTIPVATISSAPTETAAAPEAGAAAQPGEAAPGEEAAESKEPTLAELEKDYRARFAELRKNVDTEERRLDVLQRELNLAQQQFYSDPNIALREQYSRAEINKRMEDIETQKATVEKAKQAIADLEDELRKKNFPPGWAR